MERKKQPRITNINPEHSAYVLISFFVLFLIYAGYSRVSVEKGSAYALWDVLKFIILFIFVVTLTWAANRQLEKILDGDEGSDDQNAHLKRVSAFFNIEHSYLSSIILWTDRKIVV